MPTHPSSKSDGMMPSAGYLIWRQLLAKWGRDRFPTVTAQLLQLGSEVGELQGAWAKAIDNRDVRASERVEAAMADPKVLKELGDAGLALYAVADKLGIDLLDAMITVMENETRKAK
jgi:NTP pyrophosphatase (non-canonical NTP hydrolase)